MTREQRIKQLQNDWDTNPRCKNLKRDYCAKHVVCLRGLLQPVFTQAKRGAEKLWDRINGGTKKGYTFVAHQQKAGAGYFDDVTTVIQGSCSSVPALIGSTEDDQF